MKTILAPVDFSDASVNALSFAAELAKRASARLILINIIQKNEVEDDAKNMLNSIESESKKKHRSKFTMRIHSCPRESCYRS